MSGPAPNVARLKSGGPGLVIEGVPEMRETPDLVILLVEDDVLIRFTTAELLRDEGFAVLEAADGAEALRLLASVHAVDLVLSDVRMPGEIDGITLSVAIKETRPHLPVALVSTHLPPDVRHAADAFLSKPFRVPELLALIAELVGREWQSRRSPNASS